MDVRTEIGDIVELPDDPALLVVEVDLHRAILVGADLRGRRFERCSFRNALLGHALFDGARFIDCSMPMAEFDGASLVDVHFAGGLLNASSFHAARLTGATFAAINLDGVSFRGAWLEAVTFATELSSVEFDDALYTPTTRWPTGFDPTTQALRLVPDPSA